MNINALGGRRSVSPASSRASSPVPRIARRTAEDGFIRNDKGLRRYSGLIVKALSSWETSPEEWADYIAFLSRLLRAIQSHGKDISTLPHSSAIASKLAQCLNPALPSGVHQRALEVYTYIFTTFGEDHVAANLHEYLPGLSTVLSFASLSVKPLLYDLFERFVVRLDASTLRPAVKSLVLSLLPAIEEEASEDFERALSILETIEGAFAASVDSPEAAESGGYFWQCIFLSIITGPSRRQGALNYLMRRLPRFSRRSVRSSNGNSEHLSPEAEAVLVPEPGLLIRAFACGLSDPQPLIQRGYLDLLVTHLPLNSPVLQERVPMADSDRLMMATTDVLLRRDMSLNRRLWSWLLGPETKDDCPTSPAGQRRISMSGEESQQYRYFAENGRDSLERCLLTLLHRKNLRPADIARPFRICLSLMDRWEIGGLLVPRLFLPAMRSVYNYCLNSSPTEANEVVKSASLFFDGVESRLIWTELLRLLDSAESKTSSVDNLGFCLWVIQRFNMNEEEMLTFHIPLAALFAIELLATPATAEDDTPQAINAIVVALLGFVPTRAFTTTAISKKKVSNAVIESDKILESILRYYRNDDASSATIRPPLDGTAFGTLLSERVVVLVAEAVGQAYGSFVDKAQILLALLGKIPSHFTTYVSKITRMCHDHLATFHDSVAPFQDIITVISVLAALHPIPTQSSEVAEEETARLSPIVFGQIWHYLSPFRPRHHVEAVKLIWQLDELTEPEDVIKASLNELMRRSTQGQALTDEQRVESVRRFVTLWVHTVPSQAPSSASDNRSLLRRGSTMSVIQDSAAWPRRQDVLAGPLFMALDVLHESLDPARGIVHNLISNAASVGFILGMLFEQINEAIDNSKRSPQLHEATAARFRKEQTRKLEYTLLQTHNILENADSAVWQGLSEVKLSEGVVDGHSDAIAWLSATCVEFIGAQHFSPLLSERAISVLRHLLSGPYFIKTHLQALELDNDLLTKVRLSNTTANDFIQEPLLKLTVLAMNLRQMQPTGHDTDVGRRRSSLNARRKSSVATKEEVPGTPSAASVRLSPQLLETVRMGFGSRNARPNLDAWLDFLASSLPLFGEMLLTNLLPLVATFCKELNASFHEMKLISGKGLGLETYSPDNTLLKLLEGLNMILADAHDFMLDDENQELQRKPLEASQSVMSSMTSGVFAKVRAPPSSSAKANSRLTIILAFQDAVRVCINIWTWAAHGPDNKESGKYNASTTAYNALKLRNRTRHMLEQIFTVEPLESLEVVMSLWSRATEVTESAAVISILHVMSVSRPKSIVPAVLDALCSRTNATAISPSRQSSLTSDLTATEVTAFFTSYLQTVEDDAIDEIWPDCTAFMRDVLSNPLPFRPVLPALLWVVLILAEKLDNTNFGDHRKMRRELGDNFQRLLAATFAASPSAFSIHTVDSSFDETDPAVAQRNMDLVVILKHVTAKIESILESPERISNAINTISSNLISPAFHAKSFPSIVTPDLLALLIRMTRKAPTAKAWRKDVSDAFSQPRLLESHPTIIERYWYPVLQQWSSGENQRLSELMSRLTPPSSAGIMFGVGATAARLRADTETQFTLRRMCLLLLASPIDSYVAHLQGIEGKLVELFEASTSSSPSTAVKAELFMLCRALILSTSAVHFSPLWPVVNEKLQAALASLVPEDSQGNDFTNIALLQAIKLLDTLVALSPDEFQLHEWLYVTDTTDAVYHPQQWQPAALSDQIAEHLGSDGVESTILPTAASGDGAAASGRQRGTFGSDLGFDVEDIKAMPREDFAKSIVRPYLSQLSINAYESVYSMASPDTSVHRRALLDDILDKGTLGALRLDDGKR